MRLEAWHSSEDKARWKIVRTDNYTDVPGDIVSADEVTGECSVSVRKIDDHGLFAVDSAGNAIFETKALSFGDSRAQDHREAQVIDPGVQIALIVSGATIASGIGAFASSFILARMSAALRLRERAADWKRQDEVAAKVDEVASQARDAAKLLLRTQQANLGRTNEVARIAAASAAEQTEQLHHIKTLVNNEKTAMLQSNLAQTLATLALLQRFSPEDVASIRIAQDNVYELRATLAERVARFEEAAAGDIAAKAAKDAQDAEILSG